MECYFKNIKEINYSLYLNFKNKNNVFNKLKPELKNEYIYIVEKNKTLTIKISNKKLEEIYIANSILPLRKYEEYKISEIEMLIILKKYYKDIKRFLKQINNLNEEEIKNRKIFLEKLIPLLEN